MVQIMTQTMKATGRLGSSDSDYETLRCPICGKILGALCVEGRAVYKKDPCPRCKNVVLIEKDLTPRDSRRRMTVTDPAKMMQMASPVEERRFRRRPSGAHKPAP
jgi:phage FluMu protein Com